MHDIKLVSYAKINLTLEVGGKRADGYHDLDSVAQIIDIKDELRISKAENGVIEVTSDTAGVPSGPANLVYKACEAFFIATGIRSGAKCALTKRIPVQAGLGGGSGNAAAAILGLDMLYETQLPLEQLSEIAASVASDAPLFIYGGTVRMRGRGDQIEPLPDAPELNLVVVKPIIGVSTAWAYSELDKSPDRKLKGKSDIAEKAIHSGNREALINSLYNDFDPIACGASEEIAKAKQMLKDNGAQGTLLSGSGSAVFGIFADIEDCQTAAKNLRSDFPKLFVTRTLPRS
ncbi:MAG: 4-(cytidine 5'-diphospho)-2-C-methyl-D-erythritol kinase [Armatimonadetes bacterium]|nr:4-(cytidine 5'-diphospho)-2-C-methyl-D-erythritol kinase [Armatimonadota bacterium]